MAKKAIETLISDSLLIIDWIDQDLVKRALLLFIVTFSNFLVLVLESYCDLKIQIS